MKYTKRGSGLSALCQQQAAREAGQPCTTPRNRRPEEAADVITHPSTKNVTSKRLPIPLGGPKTGRDKKWTEVEQSIRDAGVQASVVAPHGTVQGLLYFNLRSQFELLNSAHLYVPEIVALEKNRSLMYFEIDLSRSAER